MRNKGLLLLAALVLLSFTGCKKMTILRTTEIDRIVTERTDSLMALERANHEALKEDYKKYRIKQEDLLNKINEKIGRLLSNVDESNQRITAIMEKTGVLTKHWEERARKDSLDRAMAENERLALFKGAMEAFQSGEYESAKNSFELYMGEHPDSKEFEQALYWSAESYYALKEFDNAEKGFVNYFKNYKTGQFAAQALFKLGLTYESLKKKKSKKMVWDQLLERFPETREAMKVQAMQ